jgi:PKD repeat protein
MIKSDVITVQLPELNFTGTPTMGGSPVTVQFTADGADTWEYHWSFGDGTTSTDQNPTHRYTTTQDQQFFTVTLTVSYGGEEQVITKPNYIDVRTKSVATFMAEQQENIAGTVMVGAVMATIAGIIVIYIGL